MTATLLPCPALIIKNADLFTYRECATPSKKILLMLLMI
jgi:hypothetical protein